MTKEETLEMAQRFALAKAAPAMLEALQRAVRSGWLSIDYAHNRTPEACDIRSAMCAAIDAATGAAA